LRHGIVLAAIFAIMEQPEHRTSAQRMMAALPGRRWLVPPRWGMPLLLAAVGALFFLPYLGAVHLFDWDEINFAECAREMMELGDYLRVHIGFRPFYQKPPLFFWLQAGAMHLLGVGEYAARLPNALCGIATLVLLYKIGQRLSGPRFGLLWALAYLGSFLPHFYCRSGIIDPVFNLFIFLGLYHLILAYWKRSGYQPEPPRRMSYYLGLAGLWAGLAVLTKGPVAILLIGLTALVYWVSQRFRWYLRPEQFGAALLTCLAVAGLWFGVETLVHGPAFVREFTLYQLRLLSQEDAGHGGFPGYHVVVLLVGCFPGSVLALRGFGRLAQPYRPLANFRRWMLMLFFVVLGVFMLVQTKILHYSSLAYFPLTFLAAYVAEELISGRLQWRRWQSVMLSVLGGLWAVVLIALPVVGQRPQLIKPLIADPFARMNLQADVPWSGWELLIGLLLVEVLVLTLWMLRDGRRLRAMLVLLLGSALTISLISYVIVPKIEGYSQRAAVEFYEGLQGHRAYAKPLNYKSFVHLFYSRFQPPPDSAYYQAEKLRPWLLNTHTLSQPAYFTAKAHKLEDYRHHPNLKYLGQKHGFAFFRRKGAGRVGPRLPGTKDPSGE
jgi:4-amino-4-deoxy-L-arabinose transferase-like glycosyltransferase